MADSNKIITIGLIAGGAYLLYEMFLAPASTAAQASAAPAQPAPTMPNLTGSSTATPSAAAPATPAAPPTYNTLDATFQRLTQQVQANASDPAISQQQGQYFAKPSVFNYYLGQVSAYNLNAQQMAAAFPGGDVSISLPAFWSGASQQLATAHGLSGIRGMGAIGFILSRRRA